MSRNIAAKPDNFSSTFPDLGNDRCKLMEPWFGHSSCRNCVGLLPSEVELVSNEVESVSNYVELGRTSIESMSN